tara:strand:+ start:548 stop:781 length:234 start_codon:yes stop_codon:yes gene_type:complete
MTVIKVKKKEYFKISIKLFLEFQEIENELNKKRTYLISTSEYGEIAGNFSIKDQDNLSLNIMYQSIESITRKLEELI